MNTIFNINVCRVCLQNDQHCDLRDEELLEKFEFTTGLQISTEDNLPKAICSKCKTRLKVAYSFIKTAQESEKNLQKFIEKICSEFKEVTKGKKSHDSFLNEDDLLSLLDEENSEEILPGVSTNNIDTNREGINCSLSKDLLLMQCSNEINSTCQSKSKLVEIPAQGDNTKENFNEEAPESYTGINILETNDEYDINPRSAEFEIEESEENHEYDMIINTQDDSSQCQSSNSNESPTEEIDQIYDEINISNIKAESDNKLKKDEAEEVERNEIETSSNIASLGNRFYCSKCSRDFSTKTNLNRHMQSHEGNKPFSCTKCKKSFTQKSTLKQHMYTHTGERPYVCEVCDRGFTQQKSLMFHMRRHTGEKPFHCEYCLITFRQKDALRIHILKHHVVIERNADGVETYSCIICQKKYEKKVEFKMHMKVHTANASEPSRTKKFQCWKCFKCFALKKSLMRHLCIHDSKIEDSLEVCFDCDLQFSCAEEYQEHLSVCHQYACSLCPQLIFNTVQELKVHLLEHGENIDQEQKI